MGQRSSLTAQGIVAANGTITLKFDPPPQGYVNTGTVTVYNSPNGAIWNVNVGAPTTVPGAAQVVAPVVNTKGTAPIGGIQCNSSEVLTLTSSGLNPGLVVNAVFAFVQDVEGRVEGVAPSAPGQGIFQSGDARVAAFGQISVPFQTFSSTISIPLLAGERSLVFLGYNVTPGHAQFTNLEILVSGNNSLVNWTGNLGYTTSSIGNPIAQVNSYEPLTIPIYGVEDTVAFMQLSGFGSVSGTALIQYVILALPDAVLTGSQANPLIVQQVSPTTPAEALAGVFFDAIVAGTKDTAVTAIPAAANTNATLTPAPLAGALFRVGTISVTQGSNTAGSFQILGATSGNIYMISGLPTSNNNPNVFPFDAQVNEALFCQASVSPVRFTTYYRELALVNNLI